MAYNVYRGNSGVCRRVEAPPPPPPQEGIRTPPPGKPGGRPIPGRAPALRIDTEDLLIAAILYLAYRSSGEGEMLMALVAYLIL